MAGDDGDFYAFGAKLSGVGISKAQVATGVELSGFKQIPRVQGIGEVFIDPRRE